MWRRRNPAFRRPFVPAGGQSAYVTSRSTYAQVIGLEPGTLAEARPVDRFFPASLGEAQARGAAQNPDIAMAAYNVDVAAEQIKIAEGALYPVVSLNTSLQKTYGSGSSASVLETLSGQLNGQLSVPIYQGGAEYAMIRQAKETLTQQRAGLDSARFTVRQSIAQAWGQLEAAKAQIAATTAQTKAAEIALDGVREEAFLGQRTVIDVLNAQQALVTARVNFVTAQHDRIVASYTLLSAVGSLSPQVLGLPIEAYDPLLHYQQVRDADRRAHARWPLEHGPPGQRFRRKVILLQDCGRRRRSLPLAQALLAEAHERRQQVADDAPRSGLDLDRDGHAGERLTDLSSICIWVRSSETRAA